MIVAEDIDKAQNTSDNIISKDIAKPTGETNERGRASGESQKALDEVVPAHGGGNEKEEHLRPADPERGNEGAAPDKPVDAVGVSRARSGRSSSPRGNSDSSRKARKLG